MKIGLLSNTISTDYNINTGMVNMGDSIISYALGKVLDFVGVEKTDIIRVPFYGNYDFSDECILPICGHFGRQYDMDFVKHANIHPLFLGLGLKDEYLTESEVEYFKGYEPILCRDEFTRNVFKKYNIESYIFGCITLLLEQRETTTNAKKYIFVDVKEHYKKYLPEEILESAVFTSQNIDYSSLEVPEEVDEREMAKKRLNYYAENGKVVITSKLHCMCPCAAMGVPVIALGENFSYRYSFVDAFVDAYNLKTIGNIDWERIVPNEELDETVKPLMLDIVKSVFEQSPDLEKIKSLNSFYEKRRKWEYYHEIGSLIRKFMYQDDRKKYIIWGASSGGYALHGYICEELKDLELVGVVDTYSEGVFAGMNIIKPAELVSVDQNAKIIIATLSGRKSAAEYLKGIGKKENVDFAFFHENM